MVETIRFFEYPPCHKAVSSPDQWDADFEALFIAKPFLGAPQHLFNGFLCEERINAKHNTQYSEIESRMEEYAWLKRSLCMLQYRVSCKFVQLLRGSDLKEKWMSGSVAFREKHARIGIAGACAISPNLNTARLSCKRELRVAYLAQNPQAYFDMIHDIAPYNLSELPVEPQYVGAPEWDSFQAEHRNDSEELHKLALGYILVLRNKLITHTLEFVANSVLDMPLPIELIHKNSHAKSGKARKKQPTAYQALQNDAVIRAYGREQAKEKKAEDMAPFKARKTNKIVGCRNCAKRQNSREGFKQCPVCAKIGRDVPYCSKECQVADWKVAHKKICGKKLDFDSSSKISYTGTTKVPSIFPPSSPSFKRPLELWTQLKWLEENPTLEYAVTRSFFQNDESTAMITFRGNDIFKHLFRAHRNRAIHDGNRLSVALICDCILWYIEVHNSQDIVKESVLKQLSAEYGWTVDRLEDELVVLARVRAGRPERAPALCYFNVPV